MAPAPPANLPLPERLKALAQTLQYVSHVPELTAGTDEVSPT
ncbi:endoplasmic reticulum protein [Aspergillus luchuensis]|uniref:Endoplasmic reticulum protein n=1 Tax=Aspergillus kawachii TaxID=1069201 RepID=A0A146F0B5_ASPKA|nr:endoplasmic reticulum protein [Aspergillus luchuensis]